MQLIRYMFMTMLICVGALCGCTTPSSDPVEPDAADEAGMGFLEKGLQAEEYLFPEYLLLGGFELVEHGIISQTPLIALDMQTWFPLNIAHQRLSDVMIANGWRIEQLEEKRQSFRLRAFMDAESLEIRAVRGKGPTRIFILYQPDSAAVTGR